VGKIRTMTVTGSSPKAGRTVEQPTVILSSVRFDRSATCATVSGSLGMIWL
jgi:hypothetical protein